jgi:excisionase family DNA binding protein
MRSAMMTEKDLLTVQDVARRLSVSVRTVWRWLAGGHLPAPVRLRPYCTRWRARDVEGFIAALPVARR